MNWIGYSDETPKNAGASAVEAPWLAFVDADIRLDPGFSDAVGPLLRPGCYLRARPVEEGIFGTTVCSRADFERVGGYDGVFRGWGEEDTDLFDALDFIGLESLSFPATLLDHLPHPVAMRNRFHDPGNPERTWAVNRIYRHVKWDLARVRRSVPGEPLRRSIYELVQDKVNRVLDEGGGTLVRHHARPVLRARVLDPLPERVV